MAADALIGNFANMQGINITVYDVEAVPEDLWQPLQAVQRESLRSHVHSSEWGRVDEMVSWGNLERYRDTRINPSILVREGLWNLQLIEDVKVTVAHNSSGDVMGANITELATSARLPGLLRLPSTGPVGRAERRAKMLAPPDLRIPFIGGKRNVHLREAFAHPDAQGRINWKREVGGVVLDSLWHSLHERSSGQPLRGHVLPEDPADIELVQTMNLLGAENVGFQYKDLPGIKPGAKLVDMKTSVSQARGRILSQKGARQVIGRRAQRINAS